MVVRDTEEGSGHFLHSKEGVIQGDPLAMIAYGIGVLPLLIPYLRPDELSDRRSLPLGFLSLARRSL